MGLGNFQGNGANHVPAYQTSGTPYVTGSGATEVPNGTAATPNSFKLELPSVTRWVVVQNIGTNALRIGFSKAGVEGTGAGQYYTLQANDSTAVNSEAHTVRLELRCKDIFFSGVGGTTGFQVIAGLTGIGRAQFPVLTGSNGFQGIG